MISPIKNSARNPGLAGIIGLATLIALIGCSRGTVRTDHRDADFALKDLRLSHSVLVVSHKVYVGAFQKSYAAAYGGPDTLAARVARIILDSMHKVPAVSIRPPSDSRLRTVLASDTLNRASRVAADSILYSLGAKYVVHVRSITIGYSMSDAHLAAIATPKTPQNNSASLEDDSSPRCIVSLSVEVLGSPGITKPYVFTVKTQAKVVLNAYQAALEAAMNSAARETAMHLRGY